MPVDNSISVTTGSVEVTGYLTQFVADEGDILISEGYAAEILKQNTSSKLTLKKPWTAPTRTDVTAWTIVKTGPFWHSNVKIAQRILDLIERLEAGMPFKPDAFGTLSGRTQYNDQDRGFIYLVTDAQPKVIYIKQSLLANDWGEPIQIQGLPGQPGPPGPSGTPPNVLTIGTIETLPAGQPATASISGTAPNQVLSLGIPQGAPGQPGQPGSGGSVLPTVTYSTSRTLVSGDANKRIRMELSANGTLTIPANAAVAFPLDTEIMVFVAGVGDVTIAPATGVTIVPATGLTLTEPGQWLILRKVGTNLWDAWGGGQSQTTTGPGVNLSSLSLSASTVPEDAPADTVVGAVIGKTPTSTLTLADSAGGRFALAGSSIVATGTGLDYETATSHQIVIRETLAGAANSPRETTLTITVTDVSDTGSGTVLQPLTLSNSSVPETAQAGAVVGAIIGKTVGSTLSLTNNAGNRFAISGTNLVVGSGVLDYETATSHTIVIRETLAGATNSPRDTIITISVADVNESGGTTELAPLGITNATVDEGVGTGTLVGTLTGVSSGSALTMVANGGGRFQLVGMDIRTTGSPSIDYSVSTNHIVTIRETLGGVANSPRETTFRIAVVKVSATPILTPLRLQPNEITEGAPAGTLVGTLLDRTSGSTLSLTNDAGGRFKIVGGTIQAAGNATDYETATSHTIVVRETLAGAGNSPLDTVLTVNVRDVVEGGVGNDTSPNLFSFPSVTGADLSSTVTSDPVTITGITAPTPISVSGLSYSKNGGSFTAAPGTVSNNDVIIVRLFSSPNYSTASTGTLTVGDKSATFTVTTKTSTGTPPTTILIEEGMWKCTMPYDASGGTSGSAVEVWPPALLSLDNVSFDRQSDGSIIFNAPVDGARTSGSNYTRCEFREILPDGSNEYEWKPETGGRLDFSCAVLELPTQTVGTSGERCIVAQIHGPNDEPCRLYFYRSGELRFTDDKAGAGTSGTETTFPLRDSAGQVSAIPVGAFFTGVVEMDKTGIRVTVQYNGVNYSAFSPLSNFWPGKDMYFKVGAYNAIGKVGSAASQQGTGRSRVHFRRILRPKHPHTIGPSAIDSQTLQQLSLSASTVAENSVANVVVGAIQGRLSGSTLTLVEDAGGRFAISGGNLVTGFTATDYETATSHQIIVRETKAGVANSPRDTTLTVTVTDAAETPLTLGALTLSNASVQQGTPQGVVVGTIEGRAPGSTVTLANTAGNRFAISGNSIVTGSVTTNLASGTSHQIVLRETHPNASNTPRDSQITITVTEVLPTLPAGQAFVIHGDAYVVSTSGDFVTAQDMSTALPTTGPDVKAYKATSGETPVTTLSVSIAPAAGSLLIACFAPDKNAGEFMAAPGWAPIVFQSMTSISGVLYWKRATGSETGVAGAWTNPCRASALVIELSGVNGAIDAAYKNTAAAAADSPVASLTLQPSGAPAADEVAVAFVMVDNASSVSAPVWTNGYEMHPDMAGSGNAAGIFAAVKELASGESWATDVSFSGTADQMMAFLTSFRKL